MSNSHHSFELRVSARRSAADHSLTYTSRAPAGQGLRLTAWLTFPADGQTCFSNLT
jgi:hypothetical protein